jgi:hypothetical protein
MNVSKDSANLTDSYCYREYNCDLLQPFSKYFFHRKQDIKTIKAYPIESSKYMDMYIWELPG